MGNGLVERMNRTLLNLLRTYTEGHGDWEEHLQLLLFAYRTTKHSSTELSPHEVLFGYNPPSLLVPTSNMPEPMDPAKYSAVLCKKLLELRELVESNIVDSACRLQKTYRSGESITLSAGQKVLVDNPTRGKLDAHWTGPWTVIQQDGTSVKIKMGAKEQVVHVNRVRPLLQKDTSEPGFQNWTPPLFQHVDSGNDQDMNPRTPPMLEHVDSGGDQEAENPTPLRTTRSGRIIQPPDRYGH